MKRRFSLIVLAATVAALLGAPSAVFGASTTLSAGTVSPGSGTTTTSFVFSVRYDGGGKFKASAVCASVAGKTLTLGLASGTALLGTYRGVSRLPAGSWTVTFSASTSQGPAPSSLAGPSVSVAGPTPTPLPTLTIVPTTQPISSIDQVIEPPPASASAPVPMPVATAQPVAVASDAPLASAAAVTAPASDVTGASTAPETAPVGALGGTSGDGASSPATAPRTSAPSETGTASGTPTGTSGSNQDLRPTNSPSALPLAGLLGDDPQHPTPSFAFYLLAAIAATTAGGAIVLLLWRQRSDSEEPLPAAASGAVSMGPGSDTPVMRTLRGSHLEQADDPILEAMGLNHSPNRPPAASRAPGSQVHRGPGVRDPQKRGRR